MNPRRRTWAWLVASCALHACGPGADSGGPVTPRSAGPPPPPAEHGAQEAGPPSRDAPAGSLAGSASGSRHAEPSQPDGDAETAAPVAVDQAPPIPVGTTVLHIGDSMAGALGIALNEQLRAVGITAILRFKTASFIPNWASGGEIPIYMERYDPDLTLISLGANEVQIEDPTIRIGAIRKLVARLGGRPCVWIAPPLWTAGDTGLLPIIREHSAPCRFMDTNALVRNMPRVSDKIHPSIAARRVWAKFVVEWLARQRDPRGSRPWDLLVLPPDGAPEPQLDFESLATGD